MKGVFDGRRMFAVFQNLTGGRAGNCLRVLPVVNAQAEIAVLQGFHKVVVVLQPLLLGQPQGVCKDFVKPFVRFFCYPEGNPGAVPYREAAGRRRRKKETIL